jgi:UDP-N-acetylglucosamine--dolichyl-phosphate N-acetylglucosaminephosphotransferase
MSYSRFKTTELSPLGQLILTVLKMCRLVDIRQGVGEGGLYTECSNLTIINLALNFLGPTREPVLTVYLLLFQVCMLFSNAGRESRSRLITKYTHKDCIADK